MFGFLFDLPRSRWKTLGDSAPLAQICWMLLCFLMILVFLRFSHFHSWHRRVQEEAKEKSRRKASLLDDTADEWLQFHQNRSVFFFTLKLEKEEQHWGLLSVEKDVFTLSHQFQYPALQNRLDLFTPGTNSKHQSRSHLLQLAVKIWLAPVWMCLTRGSTNGLQSFCFFFLSTASLADKLIGLPANLRNILLFTTRSRPPTFNSIVWCFFS